MTKTFDKKDIFSLLNAEDAKPYIGKFGYMADNVQTLRKNVEENKRFKLHDIEDDYILPFKVCIKNDEIFGFGLFLPADKVREEPKKWRPYKSLNEFDFIPGDLIRIRQRYDHKCEYLYLITGFRYAKNIVCMDGEAYTLEYLFNHY